jgi:uncharacterized RDD family membrane protein YckC
VSSQGALPSFPTGGDDLDTSEGGGYASWLRRAGGFLIDSVVVLAVTVLLAKAIGAHTAFSSTGAHGHVALRALNARLLVAALLSAVLSFLYALAFLASPWQATLGMRACRVHVARASDGGHVTLGHSAARAGIFMVEQVTFTLLSIVGLLGYLADMCWPLWDARRQTVHDKLARTVVVDQEPGT